KSDPDPRALAHVQRDKEIFLLTWVTARKDYLANFKELTAYRKTAPIRIDGVLDEPDWKNADVLTNFKIVPWKQKKDEPNRAQVQTYARIVYEQDNFYVAVVCMEPTPDNLKHAKSARDQWPSGNKIEVFFSYPDMADKYYHYAIGSNGGFYDAVSSSPASGDKSYDGQAEYAVKLLPDRWIIEMRFPTNSIGMKCFDGATWKLNVARGRQLMDGPSEQSSCSNGNFHGSGNFVNVKFAPERGKGIGASARDMAAWKNSSFNALKKNVFSRTTRAHAKGDPVWAERSGDIPANWSQTSNTVLKGRMKLHENSNDDYYFEFNGGRLAQWYTGTAPGKYRITFRAKGHGKIFVQALRYENGNTKNDNDSQVVTLDSDEWQNFTFETSKNERMKLLVWSTNMGGTVALDTIIVSPIGE
ncbi:MAG: hypothetical protein KAG97_13100, partial [Victivallales bacterium]|nr:hypothetical protein [Victivallales bacterium]